MEGKQTPGGEKPASKGQSEGATAEVSKSLEGRPDTKVTFVYCWHTPEYLNEVWKKVREADIVCIEATGNTEERRRELVTKCNRLLDIAKESPRDPEVQEAIELYKSSGTFSGGLFARMLESGKGQAFELIDMGREHKAYIKEEITTKSNDGTGLIANGDIEQAYEVYRDYVELLTIWAEARENLVIEQLGEVLTNLEEGKRVIVIQGIGHTPTYHTVREKWSPLPMEYTFIPHNAHFPPWHSLARKKRFSPEKGITDEEYRHAFLADWIIQTGVERIHYGANLKEINDTVYRITRQLDGEKVNELLTRFKQMQEPYVRYAEKRFKGDAAKEAKESAAMTNAVKLAKELMAKYG